MKNIKAYALIDEKGVISRKKNAMGKFILEIYETKRGAEEMVWGGEIVVPVRVEGCGGDNK